MNSKQSRSNLAPVLFAGLFAATLLLSSRPAAAQDGWLTLANPHWNITLTNAGYSDFLLDNTPGFEGREYLSGEWGAAVGYQLSGGAVVWPSGYAFTNWTEYGVEVSVNDSSTFTCATKRVLLANFVAASTTTNSPPLAFGSEFFQLTGLPLAINIEDLMWSDSDPDGDLITFVGVSATSSNGLALATNATQILVPANAVADGFSYIIADTHGATAIGTATISIITNVTSRGVSLNRAPDGSATISFTSVPWYSYEAERATNGTFTGTLQTWPVQAWADGSIQIQDDFTDLASKPPQAFYRLRDNP